MKHLICITLLLISFNGVAQFSDEEQHQIDSLNAIIGNPNTQDTSLADAYEIRGRWFVNHNKSIKAILDFEKSIAIIKSINDTFWLALSYHQLGMIYKQQGNYLKAIDLLKESIGLFEITKDFGMANFPISDLAKIYIEENDTINSINYREKLINYATIMKDTFALAYGYRVVAEIYSRSDFGKSLNYYNKSIKLSEAINQPGYVAVAYTGIAFVYSYKKDYKNTFLWMDKSLNVYLNNNFSPYSCYYKYGLLYFEKGDYQNAIKYFIKSITTVKENTNINNIIPIYNKLTEAYLLENNIKKAEINGLKAFALSKQSESPVHIMNSSELLYKALKVQQKRGEALEYHEIFILMKDSLDNEELQKSRIKTHFENEYAQQKIKDENEAKEEARVESEATGRRNNIQYSLIFLGILVLFGVILSLGFIKVSPTIAEGIIFFAFLILFEFVLVFSEPYLEQYTNGEPMYNLLANSVLALLIFPVHAILERLLKKRIVK